MFFCVYSVFSCPELLLFVLCVNLLLSYGSPREQQCALAFPVTASEATWSPPALPGMRLRSPRDRQRTRARAWSPLVCTAFKLVPSSMPQQGSPALRSPPGGPDFQLEPSRGLGQKLVALQPTTECLQSLQEAFSLPGEASGVGWSTPGGSGLTLEPSRRKRLQPGALQPCPG